MRRRFFLGVLLTLLALGSPVMAQERHPPYGSDVQPLDRILPGIRSGYPGRFYDAEGPFPDGYGGLHYRIKWLTPNGRVIWLDTNARTGRVIGPAAGAHWFGPGPMLGPPMRRGPGGWGPGPGRFDGPWRGGGGRRPGR